VCVCVCVRVRVRVPVQWCSLTFRDTWKRISSSVSLSSKTNEHNGNELDSCKHQCSLVNTPLPLESSLFTKDDEGKVIAIIPAVYEIANTSHHRI
jgi:hypothetical protein